MPNTNGPSTIGIDANEEKFFKGLDKEGSYLLEFENKDRWLLAFALGVHCGKRKKLSKKASGGYFRTDYLDDFLDKNIIKTIAICNSGEDLSAMSDMRTAYHIAEEYANAGVQYLRDMLDTPGDFFMKLEEILTQKWAEETQKHDKSESRG